MHKRNGDLLCPGKGDHHLDKAWSRAVGCALILGPRLSAKDVRSRPLGLQRCCRSGAFGRTSASGAMPYTRPQLRSGLERHLDEYTIVPARLHNEIRNTKEIISFTIDQRWRLQRGVKMVRLSVLRNTNYLNRYPPPTSATRHPKGLPTSR